MTNKSKIAIVSLSIFAASGAAMAAEFKAPEKDGDPNVTISAGETHKNLYTAGANVIANGQTFGDLFAAGGMVSVIGDVEADANLAGGSLSVSGKIGGDARVAGGNITISSPVGGDLLVAAGNVLITEKSSIGGDLLVAGGNVVLEAPVKGSLRAAGGNVTINSKIDGNVQVVVSGRGNNQGNLVFGPKAEILGKIIHKGPKEAVIKDGARLPAIDYTFYSGKRDAARFWGGLLTLVFLIKLIAWFLAGWLLVRYRKSGLSRIVQSIREKPMENLGLGLAGLVVIPIVIILLLVVFVGYYIAGILAFSYGVLLMISGLLAAIFLGAWLIKLIKKTDGFAVDWQAVALGVAVLAVLRLVPILGWLVCFVVFLMALGAVLRLVKKEWSEENIDKI